LELFELVAQIEPGFGLPSGADEITAGCADTAARITYTGTVVR